MVCPSGYDDPPVGSFYWSEYWKDIILGLDADDMEDDVIYNNLLLCLDSSGETNALLQSVYEQFVPADNSNGKSDDSSILDPSSDMDYINEEEDDDANDEDNEGDDDVNEGDDDYDADGNNNDSNMISDDPHISEGCLENNDDGNKVDDDEGSDFELLDFHDTNDGYGDDAGASKNASSNHGFEYGSDGVDGNGDGGGGIDGISSCNDRDTQCVNDVGNDGMSEAGNDEGTGEIEVFYDAQ